MQLSLLILYCISIVRDCMKFKNEEECNLVSISELQSQEEDIYLVLFSCLPSSRYNLLRFLFLPPDQWEEDNHEKEVNNINNFLSLCISKFVTFYLFLQSPLDRPLILSCLRHRTEIKTIVQI